MHLINVINRKNANIIQVVNSHLAVLRSYGHKIIIILELGTLEMLILFNQYTHEKQGVNFVPVAFTYGKFYSVL